jgi:hypothetical protein
MIAFGHMPGDDLGFPQTFTKIRQNEDTLRLGCHVDLPSTVPQGSMDRGENAIDARQVAVFQTWQREDGVVARHALDWRQQRQQPGAGKLRGNLAAEASGQRCLVTDYAASGLDNRGQDGRCIQRHQGGSIDHLGGNALAGKTFCRRQHLLNNSAPANQRDVTALTQRETLIERQRIAVIGNRLAKGTIEPRRFEDDHRIRIANGCQQQSIASLAARME